MKENIISLRLDDSLLLILNTLCKKTNMSKTDIIELAILDISAKFSESLTYDGINLKEIALLVKMRKLRRIVSIKRTELLSSNLFMYRVHRDIYKIISLNKRIYSKIPIAIKETIIEYINCRKQEVNFYKEKIKLTEELNHYITLTDKKISDINSYIQSEMETDNYMKIITLEQDNLNKPK